MNNKKFVVGLVFVMIGATSFAKTATQHGVGGYVSGGYHTELLPKNTQLKSPNGLKTGLGFDYRLTARPLDGKSSAKFLLNTGVGVGMRYFVFGADATQIQIPNSVDSDGYEFTFIYQLSNRQDRYMRLGAIVPLMLGAEFKRVYFTVGAKVNLALWGQANTRLQVASYGDYPQFLDPFTSMPEHQFFDARDINETQKVTFASELLASAEIGCLLTRPQMLPEVRLAVYADYGVFSFGATTAATQPAIQTPAVFSDVKDMFSPIKVNHALSTTLVGNGKLVPLTVGVRLVVSVPYGSKSAYPCRCVNDEFVPGRKK